MKVEKISNQKLVILLDDTDIKNFEISQRNVNVENILLQETVQAVIMDFLNESDFIATKMIVELISQNIGCTIIIKLIPSSVTNVEKRRRYKIKSITEPIIFKFCSAENLIRAVLSINIYKEKILRCHLIELKGKYFLVIFSKGILYEKIRFSLCEYGTIVGKGIFSCAFLKERGNLILENNAHFILNKYFDSCC